MNKKLNNDEAVFFLNSTGILIDAWLLETHLLVVNNQEGLECLLQMEKEAYKKYEAGKYEITLKCLSRFDINWRGSHTYGYCETAFAAKVSEGYYLSLDPYGESGIPHEEDGFVFICSELSVVKL